MTKCYSGDQIKENVMGETCGTCEGEEKYLLEFGGESWKNACLSICVSVTYIALPTNDCVPVRFVYVQNDT
jgi:hypothetical protein